MNSGMVVHQAVERIAAATRLPELHEILERSVHAAGFKFYALIEHSEVGRGGITPVRLHNYPRTWASYIENEVGAADPMVTASKARCSAFTWNSLRSEAWLSEPDRAILVRACREGVRDGVTVPANIAGRVGGSCSFATPYRPPDLVWLLPHLQFLGTAFFDAAKRLQIGQGQGQNPHLTQRQRECVLWVARGKSDWEIAQILGISQLTVTEHLKKAQESFDVSKRTALLSRAISAGQICTDEIGL